jgi:serine/threonine protein kinase
MFFEGVYTRVDKSNSKNEFVQTLNHPISGNPIQCNFFEIGAKVLQSIKSPSVIGFSRIEKTSENVKVYSSTNTGKPFPEYLSTLSSISDERFTELITDILDAILAIHSEGFYHQAINPNSFWVTDDGKLQLTLFETLEMRFCQQKPEGIQSNPSIQAIQQYLSPERKKDLKTLSFSDEYYSFGLLVWYIWCLKSGRLSHQSTTQPLPPFESTGTPWDTLIKTCLNPIASSRPSSLGAIRALQSQIENEIGQNKDEILDAENKAKLNEESNPVNSDIALVIENYYSDDYQIWCNNRPITNLFQKLQGSTLTVNVPANALIELYLNSNGSVLHSFNSSNQSTYRLPDRNFNQTELLDNKKSSRNAINVGLILGGIIIFFGVLIYLKLDQKKPPKPTESVDGTAFAMIPPDGYVILDTMNNNLLRNIGLVVDGVKWRFKEENWERFIPDASNSLTGKWVKDNSQKVKLLDTYFEKIEVIESEGDLPPNYELIKGNDSILFRYGKKALDDNFYRYVNNRWYRKEGERWTKLVSFEDYNDVLESYFVEVGLLQIQPMDYGYVQGEGVRYRSEPSDRNVKTILGYFKNYKTDPDGSRLPKYENTTPDYVNVLFEKNDWYLVQISQNSKLAWMSKKQFISEPVCYVPTPEEDENP